jgi:hypothetical protein
MFIILLLPVFLITGCGNRQKAEIINLINNYDSFITNLSKQLENTNSSDADTLFIEVQEVRLAFLDSASYKRRTICSMIKEYELSETNEDEILLRLAKTQYKAFDLYISIDQRSIDAQIMNLEKIKKQLSEIENANKLEVQTGNLRYSRDVEIKIQNLRNLGLQYITKIENMRSELQSDKSKILDWDW